MSSSGSFERKMFSAMRCVRMSDLKGAATLCREVLGRNPSHPEALHLLGVVMHRSGQPKAAVELIRKAVAGAPRSAQYYNSLGNALQACGDWIGARSSYQSAVECAPDHADALINLAILHFGEREFGEAIGLLERALAVVPSDRDTALLLGRAYLEHGQTDMALRTFGRAVALDPSHSNSYLLLGDAQSKVGDYAASIATLEEAIRLNRESHEAHNALGVAYEGLGEYRKASDAFAMAHRLLPSRAVYWINRGLNLSRMGERGGEVYLEQALQLEPNHVEAHMSLAEILLAQGDWQRGWREYEWRWLQTKIGLIKRDFPQPQWQGESLAGKTILIYAEQGYGDTLQFFRFLPLVIEQAGAVVFEVQAALFPLLNDLPGVQTTLRLGVDPLPTFDVHCPLMSLPLLLAVSPDTIPPPFALPTAVGHSSPVRAGDLRVGLMWAGSPSHTRDAFRSIPLREFLPLREVAGVRLVCLQRDLRPGDAETLQVFPMEQPIAPDADFLVTQRVIESLDLLISVDTSVAHLAATLGKPVWLLLPQAAEWRWGYRGETTPWYSTMRLIRREFEPDWAGQIARVCKELADSISRDWNLLHGIELEVHSPQASRSFSWTPDGPPSSGNQPFMLPSSSIEAPTPRHR